MNSYGLEKVKTFNQLLPWLQGNLNWPIDEMEVEEEPFENLTFEYDPATDLGLKAEDVAHFREICQLRPFVSNQPWGIFFISFEDKKIPIGVLKRVLGGLTLKKRQSANKSDQKSWNLHDLLFVSDVTDILRMGKVVSGNFLSFISLKKTRVRIKLF